MPDTQRSINVKVILNSEDRGASASVKGLGNVANEVARQIEAGPLNRALNNLFKRLSTPISNAFARSFTDSLNQIDRQIGRIEARTRNIRIGVNFRDVDFASRIRKSVNDSIREISRLERAIDRVGGRRATVGQQRVASQLLPRSDQVRNVFLAGGIGPPGTAEFTSNPFNLRGGSRLYVGRAALSGNLGQLRREDVRGYVRITQSELARFQSGYLRQNAGQFLPNLGSGLFAGAANAGINNNLGSFVPALQNRLFWQRALDQNRSRQIGLGLNQAFAGIGTGVQQRQIFANGGFSGFGSLRNIATQEARTLGLIENVDPAARRRALATARGGDLGGARGIIFASAADRFGPGGEKYEASNNAAKRLQGTLRGVGRENLEITKSAGGILQRFEDTHRVLTRFIKYGVLFVFSRKIIEVGRSLLEWQATLEQIRLGFAETLSISNRLVDKQTREQLPISAQIATSFGEADTAMEAILANSIKFGVPAQKLAEAFAITAGSARQGGIELEDSVAIITQLLILAERIQIPTNVLTRDIRDIFTGLNVQRTVLGNILGLTQKQVVEWIKLGTLGTELEERLQLIRKTAEQNAHTFYGLINSIQALIQSLQRRAGVPIFEEFKFGLELIRDFLKGINDSDERLKSLRETGFQFVKFLENSVKAAKELLPLLTNIAKVYIGYRVGALAGNVALGLSQTAVRGIGGYKRGVVASSPFGSEVAPLILAPGISAGIANILGRGKRYASVAESATASGLSTYAGVGTVATGAAVAGTATAAIGRFGLLASEFAPIVGTVLALAFTSETVQNAVTKLFSIAWNLVTGSKETKDNYPNLTEADKYRLRKEVGGGTNLPLTSSDPLERIKTLREANADFTKFFATSISPKLAELSGTGEEGPSFSDLAKKYGGVVVLPKGFEDQRSKIAGTVLENGQRPTVILESDIPKYAKAEKGVYTGYRAANARAGQLKTSGDELARQLITELTGTTGQISNKLLEPGGYDKLSGYQQLEQGIKVRGGQTLSISGANGSGTFADYYEGRAAELRGNINTQLQDEINSLLLNLTKITTDIQSTFATYGEITKQAEAQIAAHQDDVLRGKVTEKEKLFEILGTPKAFEQYKSAAVAEINAQRAVELSGTKEISDLAARKSLPIDERNNAIRLRDTRLAQINEEYNNKIKGADAAAFDKQITTLVRITEKENKDREKLYKDIGKQFSTQEKALEISQKEAEYRGAGPRELAGYVRGGAALQVEALKSENDNILQYQLTNYKNLQTSINNAAAKLKERGINLTPSDLKASEDIENNIADIEEKIKINAQQVNDILAERNLKLKEMLDTSVKLGKAFTEGISGGISQAFGDLVRRADKNALATIFDAIVEANASAWEDAIKRMLKSKLSFDSELETNFLDYIPGLLKRGGEKAGDNFFGNLLKRGADLFGADNAETKNLYQPESTRVSNPISKNDISSSVSEIADLGKSIGKIKESGNGIQLAQQSTVGTSEISNLGTLYGSTFAAQHGSNLTSIGGQTSIVGGSNIQSVGGQNVNISGIGSAHPGGFVVGTGSNAAAATAPLPVGALATTGVGTALVTGIGIARGVSVVNSLRNQPGFTAQDLREKYGETVLRGSPLAFAAKPISKAGPIVSGTLAGAATGLAIGAGAALAGAAAGATVGSVVPVIGTIIGAVIGAIAGIVLQFTAKAKATMILVKKTITNIFDKLGYSELAAISGRGVGFYDTSRNANIPSDINSLAGKTAGGAGLLYGTNFRKGFGRGAYNADYTKNIILNYAAALGLSGEDTRVFAEQVLQGSSGGDSLDKALIRLQGIAKAPFNKKSKYEKASLGLAPGQDQGQQLSLIRTVAEGIIQVFSQLPHSIDTARLALVAFSSDGRINIEKLKRVLETVKSVFSATGDYISDILKGGNLFEAGQKLGQSLFDGLIKTLQERLFDENGPIGKVITDLSIKLNAAAEKYATGNKAGGHASAIAAISAFAKLQQTTLNNLAPFFADVQGLGAAFGVNAGAGLIDQHSFAIPTLNEVPGPRGIARSAIVHGGEQIRSPEQEDKILQSIDKLNENIVRLGNNPIVNRNAFTVLVQMPDGTYRETSARLVDGSGFVKPDNRRGI